MRRACPGTNKLEYFMRQIILTTVFCISLLVHTAEADTDTLVMSPDKPFKEKYAAIDTEIDGLLESLQADCRKNLEGEKKQVAERSSMRRCLAFSNVQIRKEH